MEKYLPILFILLFSCNLEEQKNKDLDEPTVKYRTSEDFEKIEAGIYAHNLLIGIDTTKGIISGYYDSRLGFDDVSRTKRYKCTFSFIATVREDGKLLVEAKNMDGRDSFRGLLTPDKKGKFKLSLHGVPSGCNTLEPDLEKEGSNFTLIGKRNNWKGIRVIAVSRAYLHSQPDRKHQLEKYGTKGEPVKLLEENEKWVKVEYTHTGATTVAEGWIRKKDLHDL